MIRFVEMPDGSYVPFSEETLKRVEKYCAMTGIDPAEFMLKTLNDALDDAEAELNDDTPDER